MIQSLLTTTLPTTLGGKCDLLAYQMPYNLIKPVYTGDRTICQIRIDQVEERRSRIHHKLDFRCKNQGDQVVLPGYLKVVELKFD